MKKLFAVLLTLLLITLSVKDNNMSFSDLLGKMASGQTLTAGEQQELLLEARHLEQTEALFASLIQPGTNTLRVDNIIAHNAKITAGGGDVILDENGVSIVAPEAVADANAVKFKDGDTVLSGLYGWMDVDGNNLQLLVDAVTGKESAIQMTVTGDTRASIGLTATEGSNTAAITIDSAGKKITLLGAAELTDAFTIDEISATPSDPTSSNQGRIYVKGDKLIIQFNDAGTVRYKYLDLTGTGVTWVHDTTAP